MSDDKKNSESTNVNNDGNKTPPLNANSSASNVYPTGPITFRVRGSTVTGASPPKLVSLEEIMKAAHGIQDMALAHEIAVDQDFRLEPFEPPDNSYQKLVKETLHRAFFEILREQLNSDPPVFDQAIVLLEDVKQGLMSVLLPRHTRIKQMIDEVLDTEFIRQQAENGALDFSKYAAFVLDLMAKLAAPARDEMIQSITKMEDTVDIFRSILETLEVMKLDLANSLIAMIRPHIQAQSVTYEKEKFNQLLKVQDDGLEFTRAWLVSHIDKTGLTLPVSDVGVIRNVTAQSLAKAYLELLEWPQEKTYPETILMDTRRFADLSLSVRRLTYTAATVLVSPTCNAADVTQAADFKKKLKHKIQVILGAVESDVEFKKLLPNVAEEVISETDQLLTSLGQTPLTRELRTSVFDQITSLAQEDHKVRSLVRQRILEFLKEILVCSGGSRPVPVGLSAFSAELTSIAGTLLRIVMHNKAVYTEHYLDIVAAELAKN